MSTQGKWTPGPWRISPHHSEGVGALNGHFVADCRVNADAALIPENEANARLIAAAPELYACTEFLSNLSEDGFDHDGKTAILHARAAIAKARGDKS